jgi:uncharacterized membrane protein HdeD (DUF308 family)
MQTLVKNWWLLALCSVFDAMLSAIYLVMRGTNGGILWHTWNGTVVFAGKVAMIAGACSIAAAIWRSRDGKSWALALNGLALAIFGFIQSGLTRFPISILVFAVLISVMTLSLGFLELGIGRTLSSMGRRADGGFFAATGLLSLIVVLPSLALGLRWIRVQPGSHLDFLWLGTYFGFAAVCLMALAVRLRWRGLFVSSPGFA